MCKIIFDELTYEAHVEGLCYFLHFREYVIGDGFHPPARIGLHGLGTAGLLTQYNSYESVVLKHGLGTVGLPAP